MRKSLTKAEILRKRSDIQRVFRNSRIFRITGLHLRVTENSAGWSRVLFAATRAFPTSVERNRARRLLREAYRIEKNRVPPGYDLVFVIYPGPFGFRERHAQVMTLLTRAGVIPDA